MISAVKLRIEQRHCHVNVENIQIILSRHPVTEVIIIIFVVFFRRGSIRHIFRMHSAHSLNSSSPLTHCDETHWHKYINRFAFHTVLLSLRTGFSFQLEPQFKHIIGSTDGALAQHESQHENTTAKQCYTEMSLNVNYVY